MGRKRLIHSGKNARQVSDGAIKLGFHHPYHNADCAQLLLYGRQLGVNFFKLGMLLFWLCPAREVPLDLNKGDRGGDNV